MLFFNKVRRFGFFIFLIFAILGVPLSAQSDWVSPGDSTVYTIPMLDEITNDVTWRDHGYYEITGNLTISANDKLIIDPGMVLKFESDVPLSPGLTINGALEACGKPEEMIVFTELSDQWPWTAWRGIKFNDTCVDSECVLRYCVVEYTGSATGEMIWISNSSPTISHCQLMWTTSQFEPGGTLIFCDSLSFPLIQHSLLRSHLGLAVFCRYWDMQSNPLLLENDIIFSTGLNSGSCTIWGGGFLDGNYLECMGNVDITLGFPVDTLGDGSCTTNSTDSRTPQFSMVDGVRRPRFWPQTEAPNDEEAVVPEFFALGQNYPNPFNSATTIPYNLPASIGNRLNVTLKVYNLLGQEVKTLVEGDQKSGTHWIIWDGRDNQKMRVSSGIYFCLLRAENTSGRVLTNGVKILLLQ